MRPLLFYKTAKEPEAAEVKCRNIQNAADEKLTAPQVKELEHSQEYPLVDTYWEGPEPATGYELPSTAGGEEVVQVNNAALNNDDPLIKPTQTVIRGRIGSLDCRILLDTGAMLSTMRSSVAAQLRRDPKTKDRVSGPFALKEALNCEGAEKGRALGAITQVR